MSWFLFLLELIPGGPSLIDELEEVLPLTQAWDGGIPSHPSSLVGPAEVGSRLTGTPEDKASPSQEPASHAPALYLLAAPLH